MNNKNRILYADILRVISSFLVILLHVSGILWTTLDITSINWKVMNIYNSASRCCVQIFIMLSGMIFLNPEKNITTKNIYIKYIPKIFFALIFWSCIYLITPPYNIEMIKSIIINIANGNTNYHLWFLYMLIGLYMITPILRVFTTHARKNQIEYFLLLGIIICIILPTLSNFFPFNYIYINVNKMNIYLIRDYAIYFLLGYYLTNFTLKKSSKYVIYILGILGLISTIIITNNISLINGRPTDSYQGIFSINTMLYSVAIFLFIKNYFEKIKFSPKVSNTITVLSSYSLGIFLVHALFIRTLADYKILTSTLILPILSVPLISLTIFIFSVIATYILKKIPIINKL